MRLPSGLILSAILILMGAPAFAAPMSCQDALRFLDETLTVAKGAMGNQLADKGPFKAWLSENSLDWAKLEDSGKWQALGTFYGQRLDAYSSAEIPKLRARSLEDELRHRGSALPFAELSRANADRILKAFVARYPLLGEPDSGFPKDEIERVLQKLEFVFIHNTTSLTNRPTAPLLSSRELTAMGITTKLNTNSFNRETLRTDGNLFFFAIPYLRHGPFPSVTSQYGDVSLILSPSFAEAAGWLSPFVMYPEDLADLAERAFPSEWSVILKAIGGRREVAEVDKITPEQWQPVIRRLHEFDMKVEDLTGLMREGLRHTLRRLWTGDRAEFSKVWAQLQTGIDPGILIQKYSLGEMGIPFDNPYRALEMKVPVSVPQGALDIRLGSEALIYGQTTFGRMLPIPKGPRLGPFGDDVLY